MDIRQEQEYIFRLTIPYKDIFTTVYVVKTPRGTVLFDAASYDTDAPEYIIPMLEKLEVSAEDLKYIFISHNHTDHAGGLAGLLAVYPNACIVSRSPALQEKFADSKFLMPEDGDRILDVLQVVTIPGHTADSMAMLDIRSDTLISGDCLQLYGIYGSGNWACNIGFPTEHLQAIEKLRNMDIWLILTAHDYHPYGYRYEGQGAIEGALNACVESLMKIKTMVQENAELTDEQIAALYNASGTLPKLGPRPVAAIRREIL